ncbi:hypothetical protein WI23_09855 [Burkholderia oklahomensis C6786]|nr:hypothetical protein WI23_09855 [Burkholderia oklahomensis C6786]KUY54793.1 hypothetical protein WI23_22165 [Burkholderia oklahomensis C6786]
MGDARFPACEPATSAEGGIGASAFGVETRMSKMGIERTRVRDDKRMTDARSAACRLAQSSASTSGASHCCARRKKKL